ncbi:MAG: GT2 family glycosyltransferase [Planctomycetota bacterium]|jgi:GT2 family glycosyltransferase
MSSRRERKRATQASSQSSKPTSSSKGKPASTHKLAVEATPDLAEADLPRCSIVILNWNGRHHLKGCFESLDALDYPKDRFEVILIDNASDDGSVEEMRADHQWIRLIVNERNVGFSVGCNQGALNADAADVLVFINNDIRVEPAFLRKLVAPITSGQCAATTARMLSWDGKLMNSAGGGMNFHGLGIQRGYLEEPGPEFDQPRLTLFACGGAMAMDAKIFERVGGFDDEFFAYYEDVDLGWRTWVQGYSIRYVPSAVCYHHHSSTSKRLPVETLRLLQVRNPLLACFKNYSDANLRKVLPVMLALANRRLFLSSGLADQSAYRIEFVQSLDGPGLLDRLMSKLRGKVRSTDEMSRVAIADLLGINDLIGRWDHWMKRRAEVQNLRQRADEEIFNLFLRPMWCIEDEVGYRELHDGATGFMGVDSMFGGLTSMEEDPRS